MRLTPRWRKLLGDLRGTRGRVAMMVAALAIGSFAIATVLGAYTILTREIGRNYLGTHPAAALIEVDRVDDALLAMLRRWPGVAEAEGGARLLARVQVSRDVALPMLLFVVPDFKAARLNRFLPEQGAWPPPDGAVLLERSALPLTRAQVGVALQVTAPRGRRARLVISGLVHDAGLAPAWQEQTVYGYITPATAATLGGEGGAQLLKLGFTDPGLDAAAIERAVAPIAAALRRQGYAPGEIRIPPPRMHPHQTQMTAILVMLLVFSAMALALSAVLAATLIGAMLAQQTRQIGVMKAIGARSSQIASLYLALVAAIGVAALLIGVPAGMAAARGFAGAIAELLNLTLYSRAIPAWAVAVQVGAGLLLPLAAAALPIRRASALTVRQAIGEFGVRRHGAGAGRAQTLLARVRGLDRSLALALRNTFRRPARLALTLALLAAAGAMFLTSLNVKSAWQQSLADAAADRRHDLELRLADAAPQRQVLAVVAAVPGVRRAEPWNTAAVAVGRADGLEIARTYPDGGHGSFTLRSVPPDSAMVKLTLLAGRWLRADDTDAVVLNHMALALFPQAALGRPVTLNVHGRLTAFTVVGIAREIITPASAYTTPRGFADALGVDGQLNGLRIVFERHDPAAVAAGAAAVRAALARACVNTKLEMSEARLSDALSGHVYILIAALLAMAALMAAVGALGLTAAMGTSVFERTREFGVMRTIGATSAMVLRNVIGEGVLIGVMSWALALVLALPLSGALGRMLGRLAFRFPLPLSVSWGAIAAWLLAIVAGAALASAYPAARAARLTIREALNTI